MDCGDHQIPNSSCRFEVVAALSVEIRVLWDVTLFLTDTFSENCSILIILPCRWRQQVFPKVITRVPAYVTSDP